MEQLENSAANCSDQEVRFARAFAILRDGIEHRAFPGATVAITREDEILALKGFGRFTYEAASQSIQAETIWDLASVTKVVATTVMAMILYDRGQLDIEAPFATIVPEFIHRSSDLRRSAVTIRTLLAHSSGLPSYYRMYEYCSTREELLDACYMCELTGDPGTRVEYSDIAFILLGEALERISGESLNNFCRREIFDPLRMAQTTFNPPFDWHERIAPTEDDRRFRHRLIQGEVNDENAFVMRGEAGHAGVFSTAADLAKFGYCMVRGGAPVLRPGTIESFTRREALPPGTSRALGWDTPSHPSQSGNYFSPRSFGHLGFTGTSLWCDPERQVTITLLTNRTWPDRESQKIRLFRPRFHDAVMVALGFSTAGLQ